MIYISLSVHEIVDFILRKGDIDDRYFNSSTMLEGTRLHLFYQERQGENYTSEVPLKYDILYDNDHVFSVQGRCDGIYLGDIPTIDEIKTTNEDLKEFHEKNEEWHLGQAEFYAFMYCKINYIDRIKISLTYISQTKKDILKKFYEYTISQLETKIYKYLTSYFSFQTILNKRDELKSKTLESLVFPYAFIRKGQDQLINETLEAYKARESVFIEATTGIGKTISTIYGSLLAMKDKIIEKVFYATPKNSGFTNALKAVEDINSKNGKISCVEITAREKMCLNKKKIGKCNPLDCPFAIEYYSKIKRILEDILTNYYVIDHNIIIDIASKNKICPFELSLDLSLYTDVIICDYNYVFDPISRLKRFFEAPDKQYNLGLLIDEAHNLTSRSLDMYSQTINVKDFLKCTKDFRLINDKKVKKTITKIKKDFKQISNFIFDESNYQLIENFDENITDNIKNFVVEYRNLKNADPKFKSEKLDLISRDFYRFLTIYDFYFLNQKCFAIFVSKEDEEILLNIKCLDASSYIQRDCYEFIGTIFFSATLSPINYYKKLCLGRTNIKEVSIPSPFPKENFKILLNDKLSLLYKDREKTIKEVCNEIKAFCEHKIGNYIVFVPSFIYLELIKKNLLEIKGNIFFQKKNMTFKEREKFLNNFKENPKTSCLGICVLGGIFSEGIDLVGTRLIGVVVVSIGLSQINFENKLKEKYFNTNNENGFEYVFLNPGINKVMQSVGRLIRDETDIGAALLLDYRYKNKNFTSLFDNVWSNFSCVYDAESIKKELDSFYRNIDKLY